MMEKEKAILFIMDGVGDEGQATPLQTAKKPNLDSLASAGMNGYFSAIGPGKAPGSGIAHLLLFGYSMEDYPGRGVFEALGAGIEMKEGMVAFRGNLATVNENGVVLDRRAGRPSSAFTKEIVKHISTFEYKGIVFKTIPTREHRVVVLAEGDVSADVSNTDPHKIGEKILSCEAKEKDKKSKEMAEAVNAFTKFVIERLNEDELNRERIKEGLMPANAILLRGAGKFKSVQNFKYKYGLSACCVAGGPLYKGVAKYVGMEVMDVQGATGEKNTNLIAKAEAVRDALKEYDFIFLHVKATDTYSHDKDREGKRRFIEKIDVELMPTLIESEVPIAITGDHSTSSIKGEHSGLPCPALIFSKNATPDASTRFDEISASDGRLGVMKGEELIHLLLDLAGLSETILP